MNATAAGLVAAITGATPIESYGQTVVDVPAATWRTAAGEALRLGATFFDWLSASDDGDLAYCVQMHLYAPSRRERVRLRCYLAPSDATIESVTPVFAGADWHERETSEMFGITFTGHPNPVPLLLPDGVTARPLRKDFVLASREEKPWPGLVEPS